VRTIVGNFRGPIARHIDLDFGAIPARRIRPLDCAAGVHLHSRHVHIHVELYVADIDELTVTIAKFDEHLVVALAKRPFGRNKICGEVVNVLGKEWRAGDLCWTKFVPSELAGVENCNHADDQRDPFEETSASLV